MEENLVFAGFCAVSLAAMFGLYLFFGRYRQHESKKLRWPKILLGNLLVYVLAQPGLDSGAELRLMKQLVEGNYEFDQVVLVYCLNDIDDVTPEWNERYAKINKRLRRQRPGFLFEHSFLLNTIYYRMWMFAFPEISDYYRCDREAYAGAPWEAHKPRLKAMRDLVRSHGGQLSVVTFPFVHLIGPNYEFRAVHRQLNDFWRSIEVPHLDLLPVF